MVESWEQPVQTRLASTAARRGTTVLEIGYGLGMAAAAIRNRRPQSHWIIEAHPSVAKRAVAAVQGNALVLVGLWQDITPGLTSEMFDGIVFDGYPINGLGFVGSSEETLDHALSFLPEGRRLLRPGGRLAFIDFSCGVTMLPLFARAVATQFRRYVVHNVRVRPSKGCPYAFGPTAHVVGLVK